MLKMTTDFHCVFPGIWQHEGFLLHRSTRGLLPLYLTGVNVERLRPCVAALSIFIKSPGPVNYAVVKPIEERLILAALSTIYSFYIPASLYNFLIRYF